VAVGNGGAIIALTGPSYSESQQVSGTTEALTGITAGNGQLVAVGSGGTILLSDLNGMNWIPIITGAISDLNGVAFGSGLFVAVGADGIVLTSPDGLHWTTQWISDFTDLYSVAYGSGGFVAIGDNGAIFFSNDGATWTPRYSPVANLTRVVYGNGSFVAVGGNGAIAASIDGGQSWQEESSGVSGFGATFGNGVFVVVGAQGGVSQSAISVFPQLVNLSARANAGNGNGALVVGFVTGGTGLKPVLLRGIGPTLASYGVTGALDQPLLTLFDSKGLSIDSNDGWKGSPSLAQLFTELNAFALPAGSVDTALVENLNGNYTAQISGVNQLTGMALAEIYDADPGDTSNRLINISARAGVGGGSLNLVAGFVISGNAPKTVLIRAIGPGLAPYGITDFLPDPHLTLFDASTQALEVNTGWASSAALMTAFAQTGAFALPINSKDAALLVTLPPGAYTAQVDGASGDTGTALAEIYEVP